MSQTSQQKDTRVSFSIIPSIPKDFEGAVQVNLQAGHAIRFWEHEKTIARFERDVIEALNMLRKWQRVSQEVQAVLKSYQMRLF